MIDSRERYIAALIIIVVKIFHTVGSVSGDRSRRPGDIRS